MKLINGEHQLEVDPETGVVLTPHPECPVYAVDLDEWQRSHPNRLLPSEIHALDVGRHVFDEEVKYLPPSEAFRANEMRCYLLATV